MLDAAFKFQVALSQITATISGNRRSRKYLLSLDGAFGLIYGAKRGENKIRLFN